MTGSAQRTFAPKAGVERALLNKMRVLLGKVKGETEVQPDTTSRKNRT